MIQISSYTLDAFTSRGDSFRFRFGATPDGLRGKLIVVMKLPPEQSGIEEPGSCCTPSAEHATPAIVSAPASVNAVTPDTLGRMIALPGGTFLMGTDSPDAFPLDGEGPVREIAIDAFSLDRYPVTNELFARFIAATGYKTEAETYGWSFVFWKHIPKSRYSELVEDTVAQAPWWCKVLGAKWDAPEGPGSNINTRANHPVVQVSWNDAAAYAAWTGQRLPTEAEWEYAARGGLEQKLYPWGDKLRPNGKHLCNIWQGDFPHHDTADDGYAGTCAIDAFPPNGYGLYSVTGNVWEWCADWFSVDFHRTANQPAKRINPQGPPAGQARVTKGGSFLCHKSYCNRYRVAARSSNTPDSSTSNTGFRCAL
jgi:formylglycine-generating enzyme